MLLFLSVFLCHRTIRPFLGPGPWRTLPQTALSTCRSSNPRISSTSSSQVSVQIVFLSGFRCRECDIRCASYMCECVERQPISQSPSPWSRVLQHSTHFISLFSCGNVDNAFYFPGPPIPHVCYSVEASVVIINENY